MNICELIAFALSVPPIILLMGWFFYKALKQDIERNKRFSKHLDLVDSFIKEKEGK